MTRVLVTGASGFVGRHTLRPLLERGYDVHAAYRSGRLPDTSGVTWHAADLLDESGRVAVLSNVEPAALLHLAWYAEPRRFWSSVENLRWAAASIDLFRAAAAAGVRRIVGAGTCAEYQWDEGTCEERQTPLRPATLYGTAKLASGMVLEAFGREHGVESAWGRLFFLYGPGESPERLVGSTIAHLLAEQRAPTTPGTQARDFLHVSDAAAALVALLDSTVTGPVNIASGDAVEIRTVARTLGRLSGRPDLIGVGDLPAGDNEAPRVVADTRRLRREVGWRPSFDLERGLAATLAWEQQARGTRRPTS